MIRSTLERHGAARTAAGFGLAVVVMIPLLLAYSVITGRDLPPPVLGWGAFFVVMFATVFFVDARYPTAQERSRTEFLEEHPDESFDAQLAAVGGDETLLPPSRVLDTRTPELRAIVRWSLLPAALFAVAVVVARGSIAAAVAGATEVVLMVWLAAAMFGPLTDRMTLNDFRVGFIYESRSNAATARAMAVLVLPVVAALGLHCLVLIGLISSDVALSAGVVVLAGSAVLGVLLIVFGRPRFLLPAVMRRHGPHTLWAPVPPAPYGAGKRSRRAPDATGR